MDLARVVVYGVGAIGGWLAARLATAGVRVGAVARGETLRAVRAHGVILHEDGVQTRAPIDVADDPAALGVQDLVILAVKAPALREVAARIAPLLGPDTVVLAAMNGVPWWFLQGFGGTLAGCTLQSVDPGAEIARSIAPARVIGCVVHASCVLEAPGVVRHHMGNRLIVGEPDGTRSDRLAALAALLRRAGYDVEMTDRIQKEVWYKLWGNMTINPVCALTGVTADRVLDDELVRAFISRVMLEARAVGERIGIPIAESPDDRHAVTRKLGAITPSMLQDVKTGKPVEIDALLGAVRDLGQLAGVATPETDTLLGLARLHARGLGLYPDVPGSGR